MTKTSYNLFESSQNKKIFCKTKWTPCPMTKTSLICSNHQKNKKIFLSKSWTPCPMTKTSINLFESSKNKKNIFVGKLIPDPCRPWTKYGQKSSKLKKFFESVRNIKKKKKIVEIVSSQPLTKYILLSLGKQHFLHCFKLSVWYYNTEKYYFWIINNIHLPK